MTHKDAGETRTQDRWRVKLPQHVLSELQRWDPTQVAKQPLKEILAHLDAIIEPEPFRNLTDSKRECRPRLEYSNKSTTQTLYYDKASSTTETLRQTFLTHGQGNNRRGGRDQSKNPNYLPVAERTTTMTTQMAMAQPFQKGDLVPQTKMDTQKAAGLCIKYGVIGHWTNKCRTGWSTAVMITPKANQ